MIPVLILPTVGRAAVCRSVLPFELPEGLLENTPARVVALGAHTVKVETADGQEWELLRILVYCGTNYRIKGRIYPPHHPEVIANLERMILEMESVDNLNPVNQRSLQSVKEQLQEAKNLGLHVDQR